MSKTSTPHASCQPRWKRKLCWLTALCVLCVITFAQGQNVTGKVTDAADNSALPGASIVLKGTSVGTTTDANGEYSIAVEDPNTTLTFSFIGYTSQDVQVGGRSRIDITLSPDVRALEEVVVVGYGTQRKKDVTGSVAHVDAEKLQTEATSNLTTMLRGAIPGLNVRYNTSAKGIGDASDFVVRGETTLRKDGTDDDGGDLDEQRRANEPLIVVDGMIFYGDLTEINPADIQSFDILKDASASAIYGSRAADGVIIITTKKGKR